MKFGPFLINVEAEITELWVENSQKINCCDVMAIREGRVFTMNINHHFLMADCVK